MKEIYNFFAKRTVQKEETVLATVKGKKVEKTKKRSVVEKTNLVLTRPSTAELEDAEFFYGQQFNKLVSAGFLTRAMLQKRFSEVGGMPEDEEEVKDTLSSYLEALKVIEFYEGQKDLPEDKQLLLKKAKENFVAAQSYLTNFQSNMSAQFAQTADVKADQKLVEWLMLHFLYTKEERDGKVEYFPFFEGSSYADKRNFYLMLQEDDEDLEADTLKKKENLASCFDDVVRVITIWNAGLAKTEAEIKEKLNELFNDE